MAQTMYMNCYGRASNEREWYGRKKVAQEILMASRAITWEARLSTRFLHSNIAWEDGSEGEKPPMSAASSKGVSPPCSGERYTDLKNQAKAIRCAEGDSVRSILKRNFWDAEKSMDKKKFDRIISALRNREVTILEKQFLARLKDYFGKSGCLTEQQESLLERIYREKMKRRGKDHLTRTTLHGWKPLSFPTKSAFSDPGKIRRNKFLRLPAISTISFATGKDITLALIF